MNIYNYNYADIETLFLKLGYKKYRAKQLFEWLYVSKITDFNQMTNLDNDLKKYLSDNFKIGNIEIIKEETDVDVSKYLFKLRDNNYIEAVLMHHDYGDSICLSTQVGCNMGCKFCESGRLKKIRNLEVSEMIEPILLIEKKKKIKITRVVLMGIGEPFDNYENVMKFVNHINDYRVLNIGSRHITISTCGIIPKIKEFSYHNNQVNLAISLHAADNKLRSELMPINKAYNVTELINVLKEYSKITNRRLTFEYILLRGINDSIKDAYKLVELLKGMNCYVNLIPYNETSNIEFKRSEKSAIDAFYDVLYQNKIGVTVRREFGKKISGACGQLRAREEER